jgi:hypothetical protein
MIGIGWQTESDSQWDRSLLIEEVVGKGDR